VTLQRYQIVRGKRPPDNPLPDGLRIDTRKHTQHVLRPEAKWVEILLADPSPATHARFAAAYNELLEARFAADRTPFDELAAAAKAGDVFIGCNCPTQKTPLSRCHTLLALRFMKAKYPGLRVALPRG
jgi:hypothetical protein